MQAYYPSIVYASWCKQDYGVERISLLSSGTFCTSSTDRLTRMGGLSWPYLSMKNWFISSVDGLSIYGVHFFWFVQGSTGSVSL
jgi:hypothetical protein